MRKHAISQPRRIGKITATFMLGTLIAVAAFMYISQINHAATMGYEIKKLETQRNDLQRQNDRLKIRSAELKSIYNIDYQNQEMQMKKPAEVGYIEVEVENPVAIK